MDSPSTVPLTRLTAGSFFGAVIPPGCVLDVEVPVGLSLRLTNAAVASNSGQATLLVSQGAVGPLAPVATVRDGQVALGVALSPGRCRLAADGDALIVAGRVRQLLFAAVPSRTHRPGAISTTHIVAYPLILDCLMQQVMKF